MKGTRSKRLIDGKDYNDDGKRKHVEQNVRIILGIHR